jgi:hypothetical protein
MIFLFLIRFDSIRSGQKLFLEKPWNLTVANEKFTNKITKEIVRYSYHPGGKLLRKLAVYLLLAKVFFMTSQYTW